MFLEPPTPLRAGRFQGCWKRRAASCTHRSKCSHEKEFAHFSQSVLASRRVILNECQGVRASTVNILQNARYSNENSKFHSILANLSVLLATNLELKDQEIFQGADRSLCPTDRL